MMKSLSLIITIKSVMGKCFLNSVYVTGADDTLGFAGGNPGFPGFDGCYTLEPTLLPATKTGDLLDSEHGIFLKEGLNKDGPLLRYIEGTYYNKWNLVQTDFNFDPSTADYAIVGEKEATAFSDEGSPADVLEWFDDEWASANMVVRCGCSDTSPFASPTPTPTPEPVSPTPRPVSPTPEPVSSTVSPTQTTQECIEIESNQDSRYKLGYSGSYDGLYVTRGKKVTEICGDGGYVTCITVDGWYGIESLQFECSNGYESQVYQADRYDRDGSISKKCADGGIYSVHGLESDSSVTWGVFGDGGFSGYSSSGSEIEIGFGSIPSEFEFGRNGATTSCNSRKTSYVIGFNIWTTPDGTSFNGISLICSDYETCPQDGLYVESSDDRDDVDMENDDDRDTDNDDDDVTSGSGGYSLNLLFISVFVSSIYYCQYFI